MSLTVRFVGSGDSFGSGGRFQTCIVVDGPRSRFAIDFGASSLIALAQQGIEHNSLDAILLTLRRGAIPADGRDARCPAHPPAHHRGPARPAPAPGCPPRGALPRLGDDGAEVHARA